MAQRPVKDGAIDFQQGAHDAIAALRLKWPPHQRGTKDWDKSHCQQGGRSHGKGFGKCQRVEKLRLLPAEGKNRQEGENDDRHCKKNGPSHACSGFEREAVCFLSRKGSPFLAGGFFTMPDHIFSDHNCSIHKHTDGDGDACQRHDVRRDSKNTHQNERHKNRCRQGDRHDQDASKMPKENNMSQSDE